MGNRITVCHWNESSHWDAIEIDTAALSGHDNHDMDIWAPLEGVTPGQNWPRGEAVYLNGCVLEATASPSPSPTPSLPETGPTLTIILMVVLSLLAIGFGLMLYGWSSSKRPPGRGT